MHDLAPRTRLASVHNVEHVVQLLATARHIMVVTGAGISVASGIPDFRSQRGVYDLVKQIDTGHELTEPQDMFDLEFFLENPRPFFKFAKVIFPTSCCGGGSTAENGSSLGPQPSLTHRFIAELDRRGVLLRNYTQNLDLLELAAGVRRVFFCHGSFATATCTVCCRRATRHEIAPWVERGDVPVCKDVGVAAGAGRAATASAGGGAGAEGGGGGGCGDGDGDVAAAGGSAAGGSPAGAAAAVADKAAAARDDIGMAADVENLCRSANSENDNPNLSSAPAPSSSCTNPLLSTSPSSVASLLSSPTSISLASASSASQLSLCTTSSSSSPLSSSSSSSSSHFSSSTVGASVLTSAAAAAAAAPSAAGSNNNNNNNKQTRARVALIHSLRPARRKASAAAAAAASGKTRDAAGNCLGVLKPDITFFGEPLDSGFSQCLEEDRAQCDLLLVIGTSFLVEPVSTIAHLLPKHVPQIFINREHVKLRPKESGTLDFSSSSVVVVCESGTLFFFFFFCCCCSCLWERPGSVEFAFSPPRPAPSEGFDVELLGSADVVVKYLLERLGWGVPPSSTSTAAAPTGTTMPPTTPSAGAITTQQRRGDAEETKQQPAEGTFSPQSLQQQRVEHPRQAVVKLVNADDGDGDDGGAKVKRARTSAGTKRKRDEESASGVERIVKNVFLFEGAVPLPPSAATSVVLE